MIESKLWLILVLFSITLIFIIWKFDVNNNKISININDDTPTYTCEHIKTLMYDSYGHLNYKLMSDKISYFSSSELTWFEHPNMIIYVKNNNPTWFIHADKGKLTKNYILYLYGHVELDTLIKNIQLKYIKTENVQVNLNTQQIITNDQITFYDQYLIPNIFDKYLYKKRANSV
ncbi:LPS export ABC transporter periplasmic protein LptC [Pantoea sp. Mhis]|uniref:LPS export ABC transporter periplasmic protein LptC n=1 Tax=Pantoea sp. Mhis TaxID=2576759 RepID=UPI00135AF77E|nr:LPS export ABC transporter periplasmic protein LptC [Pantoea sp. Mhis]MXP56428.1 LPS export ABC transporter periplasmic protein LptC [Pantoea sp. Mhis]